MALGILLLGVLMVGYSSASTQQVTEASNKFGLDLFHQLTLNDTKEKNIMFSPMSISMALALAYAGAKGETREQISSVVHLGEAADTEENLHNAFAEILNVFAKPDNPYTLKIGNKLFGKKQLTYDKDFQSLARLKYKSLIEKVDFEDKEDVVERINNWVAEFTGMKVTEFMTEDSITNEASLLVIDIIYFLGKWEIEFNKNDTERRPFFVRESDSVDTEMMYREGNLEYKTIPSLKCDLLQIPYTSNKLSMYVLLPQEKEGIEFLEDALMSYDLEDLFLNMTENRVKVILPKFTMEQNFDLPSTLMAMGIGDLFSDTTADLSGICQERGTHVTDMKHRAFTTIQEDGTSPAPPEGAITQDKDILFDANHPFLFLIKEETTGAIMFMGRYAGPEGYLSTASTPLQYLGLVFITSILSLYFQF